MFYPPQGIGADQFLGAGHSPFARDHVSLKGAEGTSNTSRSRDDREEVWYDLLGEALDARAFRIFNYDPFTSQHPRAELNHRVEVLLRFKPTPIPQVHFLVIKKIMSSVFNVKIVCAVESRRC